jgi:hypothetical protein
LQLELREGVSAVDTEYGTALLDEDNGQYWELNPTGALVLRTLLGGGTPEGAVRALAEKYTVDVDTAGRDVAELLGGLREAGLVRG